jgi:hypothetical protein
MPNKILVATVITLTWIAQLLRCSGMRLRTCSGPIMAVSNDENAKIISFDRPVSSIELSYEEAQHLANSLLRNGNSRLSENLRGLLESGFFNQPRTFVEIRSNINEQGITVRSASLHVLVNGLVEKGILLRDGKRRMFTYTVNLVSIPIKSQ